MFEFLKHCGFYWYSIILWILLLNSLLNRTVKKVSLDIVKKSYSRTISSKKMINRFYFFFISKSAEASEVWKQMIRLYTSIFCDLTRITVDFYNPKCNIWYWHNNDDIDAFIKLFTLWFDKNVCIVQWSTVAILFYNLEHKNNFNITNNLLFQL